jgi:hypothetical protein
MRWWLEPPWLVRYLIKVAVPVALALIVIRVVNGDL